MGSRAVASSGATRIEEAVIKLITVSIQVVGLVQKQADSALDASVDAGLEIRQAGLASALAGSQCRVVQAGAMPIDLRNELPAAVLLDRAA